VVTLADADPVTRELAEVLVSTVPGVVAVR